MELNCKILSLFRLVGVDEETDTERLVAVVAMIDVLICISTNNNVRLIYFVRVLLYVGCNVTYSKIEMPKNIR